MGCCESQEPEVKIVRKKTTNSNPLTFSFAGNDRYARILKVINNGDHKKVILEKTPHVGQEITEFDVNPHVAVYTGKFVNLTVLARDRRIELSG